MDNASQPPQQQNPPGNEFEMNPQPEVIKKSHKPSQKLDGKVAVITGGDSGIGRATAVLFASEGADVSIIYLSEDKDASDTKELVESYGKKCLLIKGDVGNKEFCIDAVKKTVDNFGKVDIVINNAGEQHPKNDISEILEEDLRRTFQTNIFSMFFMVQAALPHLSEGSSIINTSSVTAYQGRPQLLDYSSTKGAIVSFTRSLALNLASKKIRVNAIAPGPIWTPLIPSTFPNEKVEKFGSDTPLGRAGQPSEVATGFLFLASDDASYITGQTIHINGGEAVEG